MTIEQIRRALGKEAENVSDEELLGELRIATLYKDLFFDFYKRFSSFRRQETSTLKKQKALT
jgi:hypothetical protein